MNLVIKFSSKKDAEVLGFIQRKAFHSSNSHLKNETDDTIRSRIHSLHFTFYLDDEIIGGANVFDFKDDTYYLDKIFIEPKHQNRGFGKQALLHIESFFLNAKKWTVSSENTRNHKKFYRNLGYKIVSRKKIGKITYLQFEKIVY